MTHEQILEQLRRDVMPAFCDGVQKVGLSDVVDAAEFPALVEEYASECGIAGLPPPQAKLESYRSLEWSGALHLFAASQGGRMVGFITVLAPVLPHYSAAVAVCESFFVAAAHRKGGLGLRLLNAAEELAAELGSPGLLVCAPMGGRLCQVLPRRGYAETNRVFFKRTTQ